jgi:O-antigen/teichoic acid export membrane protein
MSFISKVLSPFKNIHFQSLLGNGVMAGFGMLTFSILLRALNPSDMGMYFIFMTIFGLVDTLKGGFLTNAYIKFYSGMEESRAKEVAGSAWSLVLIVSAAVVIINIPLYYAIPYIKNDSVAIFIKYFALTFLSTLPSFMANLAVQGDKRFDKLLWMRLINQVLFTTTVIILIYLKKSTLDNVLISYIGANAIASLFTMLAGWTKFATIRHSSRKTVLEIAHFGKYSMGTSLSSNLFRVTDNMFLLALGPVAVTLYNIGGKLNQIVEIPMLSFAASGMPSLSGYYNHGDKEAMMHTMKKMVGMLSVAILLLSIIVIIFAEPIIALIGGSQYVNTPAPNLLRIFIGISFLFPADRFFALTLDVIHKPKINFYKILVMLAVNLIADYIAVSIYKSVYAIVITNVFPVIVAIVIAYVPLNKYQKFSFWNIYILGFKELAMLIKHTYQTLSSKKQTVGNNI